MKTTTSARDRVADLSAQLDVFEASIEDLEGQERADIDRAIDKLAAHYSLRNTLLILMQCPHVTEVAGYKAWQERGRQVRKGEHAIAIFAPAGRAKDETDDAGNVTKAGRQFFRIANVFDVSQTDPIEAQTTAA